MVAYIQPVHGLCVEKAAAASLATPSTSSDGVSIETWRKNSTPIGFTQAVIAIDSDATTTLTSPKLYGYGKYGPLSSGEPTYHWFYLGDLNNGTAISLTAGVGFAQVIQFPNVFKRLAVGATVSAGNVSYSATPITVIDQ